MIINGYVLWFGPVILVLIVGTIWLLYDIWRRGQ